MNSRTSIALIALSLIAGAARAQSTQAVEWKVSEGGNGHWYQVRHVGPLSWYAARDLSASLGGHLATITQQSEQNFIVDLIRQAPNQGEPTTGRLWGPWLGGYQDRQAADYSEPSGGWRWVTGEPWVYQQLNVNNNCSEDGVQEDFIAGCGDQGRCPGWNDLPALGCDGNPPGYAVVEWDADCNGDGTVDYGQIKNGQLADENANGVPDICETSITGVIPPSVAAQGGSSITINGRNFPAQPIVLVRGVAATNVVRYSDSRLTAVTPAVLPGMASVSVNGFTLPDGIYIRPECGSDLDQDGEVTAADIAIVLLDFGPCYVTATSPQSHDSKPFMLQDQPAIKAPRSR
jgi:hypothetical protein